MSLRIALEELDGKGEVHPLDPGTAAAIAGTHLVTATPVPGGGFLLQPNGRVGAVLADEVLVQVLPKISGARVLFLLGYAANWGLRPEDVEMGGEPDLVAAMAEALARQVDRCLRPGLLQGYVTVEEALPLIRGRILVAQQIARRPGLPLPMELRHDEYAVDTTENRILRTALRRLQGLSLPDGVRRRVAILDARLEGVSVIPSGSPLPAWRPSRLNARYAPALGLAGLVLRHLSVELSRQGRGHLSAAFVVNMAKVFEDFVTVALTVALQRHGGVVRGQRVIRLDADDGLPAAWRVAPDITHLVDGRAVAVLDAKYKADHDGKYPLSDVYQMFSYCTALGLDRGWLVYAKGQGTSGVRRVVNTNIEIATVALDVDQRPAEVLAAVGALAERAAWRAGLLSRAG